MVLPIICNGIIIAISVIAKIKTMYIKKKQKSLFSKPVFIGVGIIATLLILAAILEKTGVTNFLNGAGDASGPTSEEKRQEAEASAEKKRSVIEKDTKADPYNESNGASENTSIDLSAKQENNSSVTVFTKLYGYSSGSCRLEITNAGKSSSQTAEAMYQAEYASCAGFSVPIDPLGKGSWVIKLSVVSSGVTKDKTISFEVK